MRLARFRAGGDGGDRLGAVTGEPGHEQVAELELGAGGLETTLLGLLADPQARSRAAAEAASTGAVPVSEVELLAPIARPPKFIGVGLNYADHVAESIVDDPGQPIFFNKQSTCVNHPHAEIVRPRASIEIDYEGELGFVVARRARHVPAERAREVIGGFLVVNDVSVRDYQRATPTMTMGKSWDSHGPIGPWITTADEVPDPHDLRIRTWVNGELRQDASTAGMIRDCYEQVARLSEVFTLEPGDLITTGTPSGVAAAMDPPAWLRAGDVVRIEIDGLGAIENRVVDEGEPVAVVE